MNNNDSDNIAISIIIPVFNNERYITGCIESVLRQTIINNIEIICIDDGSTDKSAEIIRDYINKGSNINLIRQKNSGAGAARNIGIKCSIGDYLMFLDGDDMLAANDSVEYLYNSILQSQADICIGNIVRLYRGKYIKRIEKPRKMMQMHYEGEIRPKEFQFPFVHFSSIYSRAFICENNIMYPEAFRGQDVTFCAKAIVNAKKIYHVDKDIYIHRAAYKKIAWDWPKACGYVNCWKEIILLCENSLLWDEMLRITSMELRVFAGKIWYEMAVLNHEEHMVDEISSLLRQANQESLLTCEAWKKKTGKYWKEMISITAYRTRNYIERRINYSISKKGIT